MKVSDVMTRNPAVSDPTTSLRLVAQLMADHDCAAIPIVQSRHVVGIVTDRDIACRAVAPGRNAAEVHASEVMTSPAIAVAPDDPWEKAVDLMKENGIHHLLVIDEEGDLVGIVAASDLGRRMSNRELGDLSRATSIRGRRFTPSLPMPYSGRVRSNAS